MTPPQPTAAVLRKTILAGLVGALLLAAPAHAAVGVQDDEALKYDTAGFLARADQLGADWVRIMVPYGHWRNGEDEAYVHAAQAAHDSGRRVMVSLLAWWDYPTPDQWVAYARDVVARMGPYVDAWSPMNEPNWSAMAPRTKVLCVPVTSVSTAPVVTVRHGIRIVRSWQRVRRGHGTHTRHRFRHHWRYVKAHSRRQHRRARWERVKVRVPMTGTKRTYVSSATEAQQCSAEAFGTAYRRVYDRVAPILRADTGSVLVVGDLCPCDTTAAPFMNAFYSAGPLEVKPDVLGIHPYAGDTRANVRYAAARGMDTWATEWGVVVGRENGDRYGTSSAAQWVGGIAAIRDAGVARVFLYDTGSDGGWDTRVPVGALESIAAMP